MNEQPPRTTSHPEHGAESHAGTGCCTAPAQNAPGTGDGGACCGGDMNLAPPPPQGAVRFYQVRGLDCAEEVAILKSAVGPLVGGADNMYFDVLHGRMGIAEAALTSASDEDILRAVRKTGMEASYIDPETDGEGDDDASERHKRQQMIFTSLSGIGLLTGLGLHVWLSGGIGSLAGLFAGHEGTAMPGAEIVAYALAIFTGARFVAVKAWYSARRMRPDINLLMVLAVSGAIVLGEWFEGAAVTFLFALSLLLESWSVGRARRAIASLLDLSPQTVRIIGEDGTEREIPAAEVAVGTTFIVRPGDRIPLDGRIVKGHSAIDQAPITGESVPVEKDEGDEVYAGTINGNGALTIVSTQPASNTMLARIIRMVRDAGSKRAQSEQWVEKFATLYTPAVMVVALLIAVIPPLAFGGAWDEWIYRALVLLVIACPCALVISTPVSIVAALAAAARAGVLIKGGTYVEQPARLQALAFDKTGTLTLGKPQVVAVRPLNGHDEATLLKRTMALEARSSHPLAQAILAHGEAAGLTPPAVENMEILPGMGVTGEVEGRFYWLGSHRYLRERGIDDREALDTAAEFENQGCSVVAIGTDDHVCGLIALADRLRPEAPAALQALREAGVTHLVMLTGDNSATARSIARQAGIDEVRAELLPADKVAAVEELVQRHGTVAMVGDGVNDAPAMARASFGIAMGAAGTDTAIEAADIALMSDDLNRLPWLVRASRRTLGIIRQNIYFALGVKLLFFILTFAGYATLWGAIAADVGASLLVIANALRLLHMDRNRNTP